MIKYIFLVLSLFFSCQYESNKKDLLKELQKDLETNQEQWDLLIDELAIIKKEHNERFRLSFSPKRIYPKFSIYDSIAYIPTKPRLTISSTLNRNALDCNVSYAYSLKNGFKFELSDPIIKNYQTILYYFKDVNTLNEVSSLIEIKKNWYVDLDAI